MKILIVNLYDINKLPPVKTLIEGLTNLGHDIKLMSWGELSEYNRYKNIKIIPIANKPENILEKGIQFFERKKKLRDTVNLEMRDCDLLWTTTDITVRELGNTVLKYKHVMQLMELIEDVPLFPGQNKIKAHIDKYARNAYKVVVPEYNRAQILKTWWNLNKKPEVLPNAPIIKKEIEIPNDIKDKLADIVTEKRKVIIYQGIFRAERNLEEFAKATRLLGEEYAMYIMGFDTSERKELCRKYPEIKYLGFINPPYHLYATQFAHIGLLPYIPSKNTTMHYSILNSLYCAPNKLYEYAAYGVPMVGTDVPGLKYPFGMNQIGYCCEELRAEEIVQCICKIEKNYDKLSENCKKFYASNKMECLIDKILSS